MPAAARGDRRGPARARLKPSANRVKARPSGPPPRAVSKLHAGRRLGFPRRAASLAAGLIVVLVAVVALATGGRGQGLIDGAALLTHDQFAGFGLTVKEVHLQGASRAAQEEIAAAARVKAGEPLLGVDLDAVRARVERVGWVQRARVMRLFPDTLVIAVTERPLLAVWQHGGRMVVVTNNGAVAGQVDPLRFAKLPLIVGEGANLDAGRFIPMLQTHPRLWARTTSLIRVDQRRWNLTTADGGVVLLPATGEEAALKRLDDLDATSRILALRIARIDLRDPEMIVVRTRGAAPAVGNGVETHG